MSTIAIIPARGGSKGIPKKNLLPLCGRPLLEWTIRQALASRWIDRVIVTTDDEEIAACGVDCEASVFYRSPDTATDTAPTELAITEVLLAVPADRCVLLQCTSPIRQPGDIDACVDKILSGADSCFSVREVHGYTWALVGDYLSPRYLSREMRQRQTSCTLEENGSIYAFRVGVYLQEQDRICGHYVTHPMHPLDSFQIDTPEDVEILETLMPLRLPHDCHITA